MIPEDLLLTPFATRTLRRAVDSGQIDNLAEFAGQLVLGFFDEESVAGCFLESAGLSRETICSIGVSHKMDSLTGADQQLTSEVSAAVMIQGLPDGPGRIVAEARRIACEDIRAEGISSQHLLAAMLQFNTPISRLLEQNGVTSEWVLQSCVRPELSPEPIAVPFALDERPKDKLSNKSVPAGSGPARVLDACMNRAREGLRVLEDYARFIMDDGGLVRVLKDLRHSLTAVERKLVIIPTDGADLFALVADRDVAGDTGTCVTGSQEQVRGESLDVVHANARRVQESLRSLEEFSKLIHPALSAEMKQLRYQMYEVHQRMLLTGAAEHDAFADRRERLRAAHLCVLISEDGCRRPWKQVVESCLIGGADIIQLREKDLDDREVLARARWLSQACRAAGALCIINDRPDITHLSGADGVHLGQHDCSVSDARRLIGPDRLIGLSTHNIRDIETADAQSADYLGVGPVFSSVTKEFDVLAGLEFLRRAGDVTKPWFAIGGIGQHNIHEVTETGASRVAVSSAVISAERPECVVPALLEQLVAV